MLSFLDQIIRDILPYDSLINHGRVPIFLTSIYHNLFSKLLLSTLSWTNTQNNFLLSWMQLLIPLVTQGPPRPGDGPCHVCPALFIYLFRCSRFHRFMFTANLAIRFPLNHTYVPSYGLLVAWFYRSSHKPFIVIVPLQTFKKTWENK